VPHHATSLHRHPRQRQPAHHLSVLQDARGGAPGAHHLPLLVQVPGLRDVRLLIQKAVILHCRCPGGRGQAIFQCPCGDASAPGTEAQPTLRCGTAVGPWHRLSRCHANRRRENLQGGRIDSHHAWRASQIRRQGCSCGDPAPGRTQGCLIRVDALVGQLLPEPLHEVRHGLSCCDALRVLDAGAVLRGAVGCAGV